MIKNLETCGKFVGNLALLLQECVVFVIINKDKIIN